MRKEVMKRALLSMFAVPLLMLLLPTAGQPGGKYLVYIGTYTDKASASRGIYAYRYDSASGQFVSLGLATEAKNPSFLAVHSNGGFVYAVNEVGDYQGQRSGGVSAFRVDRDSGRLTFLNGVASRGADPCYISFDKTGHYALVANYTGGSVATFPVSENGRLGQASAFVQETGSSVNRERQESAHAHWIEVTPDNHFALAADLGTDQVRVYRFDAKKGSLTPSQPPFAKLMPGSGPRHVALSRDGKFVYVLSELKSTVSAFKYDPKLGTLLALQTISALPEEFSGKNDAAELVMHPSGKFIYASNRGEDAIAVFKLDSEKGTLTPIEHVPTRGKTPRNIAVDPTGSILLAANQDSNNIVIFKIDSATGRLASTGQKLEVPSPVCIVFLPLS
jgi:6-phosphogluconolactonase